MIHNHDHVGVKWEGGGAKYAEEGGGDTRFAPSLVALLQIDPEKPGIPSWNSWLFVLYKWCNIVKRFIQNNLNKTKTI